MSRYSAEDAYCYPGTSVLRNKLELTKQDDLDQYEGEITALRGAIMLLLLGSVNFLGLQKRCGVVKDYSALPALDYSFVLLA